MVQSKAGLKAVGWVGCLARCLVAQMDTKKVGTKALSSVASMVERKAQSSDDT